MPNARHNSASSVARGGAQRLELANDLLGSSTQRRLWEALARRIATPECSWVCWSVQSARLAGVAGTCTPCRRSRAETQPVERFSEEQTLPAMPGGRQLAGC